MTRCSNQISFDMYNSKKDIPERLEFTPDDDQRIRCFKEVHIYKEILKAEKEESVFAKWVDFNKNGKWDSKEQESEGEDMVADD